jgi:hypothetical protein
MLTRCPKRRLEAHQRVSPAEAWIHLCLEFPGECVGMPSASGSPRKDAFERARFDSTVRAGSRAAEGASLVVPSSTSRTFLSKALGVIGFARTDMPRTRSVMNYRFSV